MAMYDYVSGVRRDIAWSEDAEYRRTVNLPYLSWRDFEVSETSLLRRRPPVFTILLSLVCISMLVFQFYVNDWIIEPLDVNPTFGVSSDTLIACGARVTPLIVNEGERWRLISSIFMHTGIVHLVFNLTILAKVGSGIERTHGAAFSASIFLLGGFGGNVFSATFLPQFISVGASGGIFALMGACLADVLLSWDIVFSSNRALAVYSQTNHNKLFLFMICDVVFNVVLGFFPFVDNFCHVGGMLVGFFLAFGSLERIRYTFFSIRKGCLKASFHLLLRLVFPMLGASLVVGGVVVLFTISDGETSPFPSARFLSCIPMPPFADEKWWYCDDCALAFGNANFDSDKGYYAVELTCPDDSVVAFDLAEPTFDIEVVDGELESYCREECGSGVYQRIGQGSEGDETSDAYDEAADYGEDYAAAEVSEDEAYGEVAGDYQYQYQYNGVD
jgi:membrane associated rhomboid family serine protease